MSDITFKHHDPNVMLELWHVTKRFGGLTAVGDVSFKIKKGEIYALIGPNGAGKTTIFNLITGVYALTEGRVIFDGTVVGQGDAIIKDDMRETDVKPFRKQPYDIMSRGMARTFQNIRLFKKMSVIENVKTAMQAHTTYGMADAIFRTKKYWQQEAEITARAKELLEVVHLSGKEDLEADNLPYGEQRRLEIARALATDMKLLLLDEPAAGMNPTETEELLEIINYIRNEFKVSVLLIEHDMSLVMKICERIQVLDFGTTIASGTPEQIANDPHVIEAYLGKDEAKEAADA